MVELIITAVLGFVLTAFLLAVFILVLGAVCERGMKNDLRRRRVAIATLAGGAFVLLMVVFNDRSKEPPAAIAAQVQHVICVVCATGIALWVRLMAKVKCKSCNHVNKRTVNFCASCGRRF